MKLAKKLARLSVILFLTLATGSIAAPVKKLPGGAIARAKGQGITKAFYGCPTSRYDHGILGDATEAGCIVAKNAAGQDILFTLPENAVFEDITPRLADINGDGSTDIVTILTSLTKGASLAILSEQNGTLKVIAQTPYIGRPHRWLAPAGIADFDGDGRLEIAFVRTPHIGGTLEFWGFNGSNFRQQTKLKGFSNHRIGLTRITTSRLKDFDGDGITDLALPNANWSKIRIISLAKGGIEIEQRPFKASFFNR